MEFKIKKLSEVTAEVTLKTTAEEVDEAYRAAYKKAQTKIKLPGFRKGRVPLEMVEKHLGESVAEDAARELIAATFEDVVEDLDPAPISLPRFEIESFERGKGAVFKGTYDTMPKVKLGKYKKLKVSEDKAKIDDAVLKEELERLRKENATLQTREGGAQKDDYATAEIVVRDSDGKEMFSNKEFRFQIGAGQSLPGFDDQVEGMEVEQEKSFELNIDETFPDAQFAGKTVQCIVKLTDCRFADMPELNDEFAKDMGEYDTLADLEKELREKLEEQAKTALKQKAMNELVRQAVEGAKVSVPDSVVENEMGQRFEHIKQRIGQKDLDLDGLAKATGQSREDLEKELRESAQRGVEERLVLREILETEAIEVADDEIEQEIRTMYGQFLQGPQLDQFVGNEKVRDDVRGRLLYVKCLEWLYDNAEVKTGNEISYKQLKEEGALS